VLLVIPLGSSQPFGDEIDIPFGRPDPGRRLLLERVEDVYRGVARSYYPSLGIIALELKGNLAAMLSAAQNAKRSPEGDLSLQIALVAGAGFAPATFGL
jgi:hypothetical protein